MTLKIVIFLTLNVLMVFIPLALLNDTKKRK